MAVWSRLQRAVLGSSNEPEPEKQVPEEPVEHAEELPEIQMTSADWSQILGSVVGTDALINFDVAADNSIDLTQAHPSGVAQLLAGRKTRLSTLVRDLEKSSGAQRTANRLRVWFQAMSTERGLDIGYLAAGVITWQGSPGKKYTAPVMLLPVSLNAKVGHDDYELQLNGTARANPALIRVLKNQHGIEVDPNTLVRLAYNTARFEPSPVLSRLRELTKSLPEVSVEHRLAITGFQDLSEHFADPAIAAHRGLLPKIQEAAEALQSGQAFTKTPEPFTAEQFPPLDDRAPAQEFLVQDADHDQQLVLDAIAAGNSLVVSGAAGTGKTQTALNAITSLVFQGRNVLVVSERRAILHDIARGFEELGLSDSVFQVTQNMSAQQLKTKVIRSIKDKEDATEPQLENLWQTLTGHRQQLISHVESLHTARERWGCSPYQAMQALAELTSLKPGPATTVRLKRSVLDAIKDRQEVAGKLRRAAELGSFDTEHRNSPWYGAQLTTRRDAEDAHRLAVQLRDEITELNKRMELICEFSHIRKGENFNEWGEQLRLLLAIRKSLDRFVPDIFDKPVDDLLAATATNSWRREHGVDMPTMQRTRLRRVAREYVRPGVHIDDLHESLAKVQEQRTQWEYYSVSQRHPKVPPGLARLSEHYLDLNERLVGLSSIFEESTISPVNQPLGTLPATELLAFLGRLSESQPTLEQLPERTLLEAQLREQGLDELLDDFSQREITAEQAGKELELAWWQSVLEAMISGDDLTMSDGQSLRATEAEYRVADQNHINSGADRLRWKLSRDWIAAVMASRGATGQGADFLRTALLDGRVSLEALESRVSGLMRALLPIWTMTPWIAASVLPADKRFDAVVILDAEATSLQAVLPLLARGDQIIAFADPALPGPTPLEPPKKNTVSSSNNTEDAESDPKLLSAFEVLRLILPTQQLRSLYRMVDESLSKNLSESFYQGELTFLPDGRSINGTERSLIVDYVPGGTGLPSTDDSGIEAVPVEVDRVVDLVFESARNHPQSSLAVITVSELHARRVAVAVRSQLSNYPELQDFFYAEREPFHVVPVDRAASLVRDRVIFSLGFGQTPHGRAIHNFGSLSLPEGRSKFVLAMTRAREHLNVVSCYRPEDLNLDKLTYGARDFYDLLLREMGDTGEKSQAVAPAAETDDDPLVADLADRLRARGARVWYNYEDQIDMVAAPDPLSFVNSFEGDVPRPVAVESDGSDSYRQMPVRERSRLRPQRLEQLGWRSMSLWTIEIFTDPVGRAEEISRLLKLDSPLEGEDLPILLNLPKDSPVIPSHAPEDTPQAWGDAPEDRDKWLREQKPPHWES